MILLKDIRLNVWRIADMIDCFLQIVRFYRAEILGITQDPLYIKLADRIAVDIAGVIQEIVSIL